MYDASDSIIGLSLVILLSVFMFFHQDDQMNQTAVLGEVSRIIKNLEDNIETVQNSQGAISASTSLVALFQADESVVMAARPADPWLMPDLTEVDSQVYLGGCPLSQDRWAILRLDRSALTQVPEQWDQRVEKICLDLNGKEGPNIEGHDVIWLAFSRVTSPHITLIPSQ